MTDYTTYERNGTWYLVWYEDGKRKFKSLRTKNKREVPRLMEKAIRALEQDAVPTLSSYAQGFFEPGCRWTKRRQAMGHEAKPITLEHYHRALHKYILPAHGSLRLDKITPSKIEDFGAELQVSNSYRNEILRTYRIIMDEAARDGKARPMGKLERFARKRSPKDILSHEDLDTLFPDDKDALNTVWRNGGAYEPRYGGLMWGAMYMVMVSAGLRSGEARALEMQHLYLEDGAIAVVQAFDSVDNPTWLKKGSAEDTRARVVPIPERTIRALRWWLEHRRGETQYVFEFLGAPLKRMLVQRRFLATIQRAGIQGNITPHSLRYTYNTRMETRLPGEVLRAIVGHRSEAMTQHYSRPIIQERVKELDGFRGIVDGFWS